MQLRSGNSPALAAVAFAAVALGFCSALPELAEANSPPGAARPAALSLEQRLERRFAMAPGAGGGLAVDLRSGRWIWAHLPDRGRIPASVTKLFTTASVLLELGATRRVETVALSPSGELVGSTLPGDLFIKGGGDPSLGATGISSLARSVRAQGIRAVGARVVGDDGLFDRIRGVPAHGPGIDPYLGGALGALAYDHSGSARAAAEAFTLALRRAGVAVGRGRVATGTAPRLSNTVATLRSPELSTLVRLTNTPSDNFYAEMLLKLLGTARGSVGSTSAGLSISAGRIRSLGSTIRQVDGSGLSRGNQVTPRNVIRLLARLEANASFTGSLAIAGRTGTLADRLTRSFAAGRCRAKTGTLSNVSALAGYCPSPSGGNVAFALIHNGTRVASARSADDDIVNALASWRRPAAWR